jgi:hypothetical protein
MCGILFCLCRSREEELKYRDYLQRCRALVKRRGPDVQDEHRLQEEANVVVSCYSSVLWLQVIAFLLRLYLAASVADQYLVSCAFLTPGSGMGKKSRSGSWMNILVIFPRA